MFDLKSSVRVINLTINPKWYLKLNVCDIYVCMEWISLFPRSLDSMKYIQSLYSVNNITKLKEFFF